MKLTKSQLKKIIKEEYASMFEDEEVRNEFDPGEYDLDPEAEEFGEQLRVLHGDAAYGLDPLPDGVQTPAASLPGLSHRCDGEGRAPSAAWTTRPWAPR